MVITTTLLTLSLSMVIGGYFLAAAVFLFNAGDKAQSMLEEFRTRPAFAYVTGIVTYAIGAALVLVHNSWVDPLAIVITLIGWIALIEGLVLIAMPNVLLDFGDSLLRPDSRRIFAIVTLVLDIILFILGLIGRAG